MKDLAAPDGLRFVVHLPLDIDVCSTDGTVRSMARRTIERLVDLTAPLAPSQFLLHAEGPAGVHDRGWRTRLRDALVSLPQPHARFAVETLAGDLRDAADLLAELGFSVCIDVGHLLAAGRDVAAFFQAFRGSISMVHVHGVRGGRDHLPLSEMPPEVRAGLRRTLAAEGYRGSLCVEVFSAEGFLGSLPALVEIMPC